MGEEGSSNGSIFSKAVGLIPLISVESCVTKSEFSRNSLKYKRIFRSDFYLPASWDASNTCGE